MTPRHLLALLALSLIAIVGCAVQAPPAEDAHAHAGGHDHAHGGGADFEVAGEALVSFKRDVAPVLRLHCAGCHTAPALDAAVPAFFDAAGNPDHAVVQAHAGLMLLELQTGRMPKGKPDSVPADQFRTLDVWAASGAPDN